LNEVSGGCSPTGRSPEDIGAATQTLDHVDAMIGEPPDLHQAILELRQSLSTVNSLTGRSTRRSM